MAQADGGRRRSAGRGVARECGGTAGQGNRTPQERLSFLADRAGIVTILIGGVMLLVGLWRTIVDVTGRGTIVVSVLVIAFGLLAGHLLGGPGQGKRGALASANVSRHPGLALLLATGAMPDHVPSVTGGVLVYFIASWIVPIPYERWLKRTATPAGPQAAA